MRRIFLFFLCCLLCTSAVFADDELSDDSEPVQVDDTSSTPVVVDITSLLNMTDSRDKEDDEPKEVYVIEPQLVNVETSIEKVSASDTTGFKSVILGLLGDYETVVTDYTYNNGSYQSHTINIERDWAWICSLCLFVVVIWCVFRGVVAILCRK